MIVNEICMVVSQKEIAANIFELILEGNITEQMNQPGQFVHVKVSGGIDPLLRRPLSIADIDKKASRFTLIYRKQGRGTAILAGKRPGDEVDILGPLGNGFPLSAVNSGETALLVGGGIGVPPLHELSKRLRAQGTKVIHVLGFQSKDAVFYEEAFKKFGETYIATDDGSYGEKGFVTDVIEKRGLQFDCLFSCGPVPMLRALKNRYGTKHKIYLSLEERMACGLGACFACVCRTSEEPGSSSYKKICSDGPVFSAEEVLL